MSATGSRVSFNNVISAEYAVDDCSGPLTVVCGARLPNSPSGSKNRNVTTSPPLSGCNRTSTVVMTSSSLTGSGSSCRHPWRLNNRVTATKSDKQVDNEWLKGDLFIA